MGSSDAANDAADEAADASSSATGADESPRPKSPAPDDKKKPTHIRFLVSNTAAGCIIGKGGSTIMELQSKSGAHIQLSRNYEFFPGTSERTVMISGAFDEIMNAMNLILEKLLTEAKESNDAESGSKVRLIVPNSSCGGIIGKGGSTIKSFTEDSRAGIKISPNLVGLNDRLITVTGSLQEQIQAIFLILSKLTEDAHYLQSKSCVYPYAVGYVIPSVAYNTMTYGTNGIGGKNPLSKGLTKSPSGPHEGDSLLLAIADEHIGLIVGRGGRNLMEISQVTGARIKISDRGDFMSGTSDRKVMISGTLKSIHMAEAMIMQKIPSGSDR